ncbi:MAG: type II toxin-antitoxin system Phd/YefM family antitoxin [Candidatus Competibacteraceae bacterium]|nr:type II toxin-antitoxin system Phd/YefM family antitoxin [Candidatus Competibacteraceae bacterium]MBK8751577.1 type II toxin-antitoxin system Phd/YefM family antitoxin [Candidatus Competibacteraceae bacterium]
MNTILADLTVSIAELQNDFVAILAQADNAPVAVLHHDRPEAYVLPAAYYEQLVAHLEDLEDARLIRERGQGPFVEVSLDDL